MKELLLFIKREQRPHLEIDCGGGDVLAAMKFVKDVKKGGYENKLSIHIMRAGSAAAYIALKLNCKRTIEQSGTIIVHGGRIEGELNELFLSGVWVAMSNFFKETIALLRKISTPERHDIFSASNHLTLNREEIEKAGIKFI
ncbi:MAG: hypothetical protein ACYCZW_03755 [Minisyncoccota bacterium]